MDAMPLKTMLIALTAAATFGGWPLCCAADESRAAIRPATKTDRLAIAAASGLSYTTVETRVPGTSILCRIPIEIGITNMSIFRPSPCS